MLSLWIWKKLVEILTCTMWKMFYALSGGFFFFFLCLHCVSYLFFTETVTWEPLRKLDRLQRPHSFLFICSILLKRNHATYPFRVFLEINCLNSSFELPGQLMNHRQPHGYTLSEYTCSTLVFMHVESSKQTELWGGFLKNSGPVSSMNASQCDHSQAPYYLWATTGSPGRMATWVLLGFV